MAKPKAKLSTKAKAKTKKSQLKTTNVRTAKKSTPVVKKKASSKKSGSVNYQTILKVLIEKPDTLQKAVNKEVTAQSKQISRLAAQFKKAFTKQKNGKPVTGIKTLEKQWTKTAEQLVQSQYFTLCLQAIKKALSGVKFPKPETMPTMKTMTDKATKKKSSIKKTKKGKKLENTAQDMASILEIIPEPTHEETMFSFHADQGQDNS